MNRLISSLASAAVLLTVVAAAGPAQAQGTAGTTGTTGGTLTSSDFFMAVQDVEGTNLSLFDQARFFNRAACDCDKEVFIYVTLLPSGFAKRASVPTTGNVQLWIGTGDCTNTTVQANGQCIKLDGGDVQLGTFMSTGKLTVKTSARVLSQNRSPGSNPDAGVSGDICATTANTGMFQQSAFLLVDYNSNATYDVLPAPTLPLPIDLTPPPAPAIADVKPGNEAVVVSWTPIDFALTMDLAGYQVLCRRGADLPVFAPGTFTPYVKSCDKTALGTGPEGLDPRFVCSPLLSRSTSSFRVKILQNDIVYGATVVAVDNSGNASTPEVIEARAEKTVSFYDYYRRGDVQGTDPGGFCAVAPAGSGAGRPLAGAGVSGVAIAALVLRARRRRRGQ